MKIDRLSVQIQLRDAYTDWLSVIRPDLCRDEVANALTPPLFLSATQAYCDADLKIIVFGKETRGWGWIEGKKGWRYPTIWTMCDIRDEQKAVERMMTAYELFDFGRGKDITGTGTSLFLRGYREIGHISGAGLMWSNLCRMACWRSIRPGVEDGRSFLEFEPKLREKIVRDHAVLAQRENRDSATGCVRVPHGAELRFYSWIVVPGHKAGATYRGDC